MDSRFPPIEFEEISKLQVGISLLTDFEKCHFNDWEIGVHGVWIDFKFNNRSYSSTFLPQVAKEQNWTKEETISFLIKKAGCTAACIAHEDLSVTRYRSLVRSMSYQQYKSWRCASSTN